MEHAPPAPEIKSTLGLGAAVRKGRFTRRRVLLAALVLVLAVGVYAWYRASHVAGPQYKTAEVQRSTLVVTVSATGTLQPTNQVDVGSELSGVVRKVNVDYNDRVESGQVVAELDADRLKAQVLQSQAALESAQARLLQAVTTRDETSQQYERVRALIAKNIASQQDLLTAEAKFKRAQADEAAARADISRAKAALNADHINLDKSVIRAPISGVVLVRNVEPGQTVAAALQAPVLFVLAEDLTHMELNVDVDEADVGKVAPGQSARFTVDAHPERTFQAKVAKVHYASQTVAGVVTYKAVLQVDNSELLLRPGMTATSEVTVLTVPDALLVPNAALRFTPPVVSNGSAESGSWMRVLFRPRRRPPAPQPAAAATPGNGGHHTVWTLRNGQPAAIQLRTGAANALFTEVREGDLRPGEALLVDVLAPAK
jgi:HlyD family secretion protein